jgi:hypothetical protein
MSINRRQAGRKRRVASADSCGDDSIEIEQLQQQVGPGGKALGGER